MKFKANEKKEAFLWNKEGLHDGCDHFEYIEKRQLKSDQACEMHSILTPFVNVRESFNLLTVKGHTNEVIPFFEWIEDEICIPSKYKTNKKGKQTILYKYINVPIEIMEYYFVYKTYVVDMTHHVNEQKEHYIPINCILDIWQTSKTISDIPEEILALEKNI